MGSPTYMNMIIVAASASIIGIREPIWTRLPRGDFFARPIEPKVGQAVRWQALIASNWLSSVLTRNWTNGSLISLCFISVAFIRPQNRIALAVDKRLAVRAKVSACKLRASWTSRENALVLRTFIFGGRIVCLSPRCLPRRFIGISFSVVARSSRVVNCKLPLCRGTGIRVHVLPRCSRQSCFMKAVDTLGSSSFLQDKTREMISDVKKSSPERFAESFSRCVAPNCYSRKLALDLSISRIKCFNPAYV